jgi:hypothetical protein
LVLPLFSYCVNISPQQASLVAFNFYSERANLGEHVPLSEISVSHVRSFEKTSAQYYVCDMKPNGFVVVSASSKVIPVLAYSFENSFAEESELPEGFLVWMDHYNQQIEYANTNNIIPQIEISNEWQRLLNTNFSINSDFRQLQSVAPLLVSKWDQTSPYNNWCPVDPAGPGGHCYAGCVATAMGQLLYYYRFPQQGQGSYTYTHPDYGTLSADFGATTYCWDAMPTSISKANDAIGQLLFHLGVSVDMDYGPDGSGMWNHHAALALQTYFRYGPETQYYFRDSVSIDWDSLLVANLDQRKPLYYAGWAGVQSTSGHAFVCDGYQPGNYYHFNWGWGGSQDGYFYTNNLTPGGNNFNFAQEVIPLFPDTLQNLYPPYCQGFTTLTGLRGSVEDGSGWFNYKNNTACSWLIAPQDNEYDSIKGIRITFSKFNTEAGADTLIVYDGPDASAPVLGVFSGISTPGIITTTGNKAYIEFHSNADTVSEGWQFDYESLFPVYCSGITTLSAPDGNIEDGSGDKKYSSNSVCRWKILSAGGMPVTFSFTSFETYDSLDFVRIYDLQTQEILGTFSGNQFPPQTTATSGNMMIVFMTNGSGNAQGWSGEYHTSALGVAEIDPCLTETLVYPNPSQGQFTIEKFIFENSASELNISVVNSNGELLYNKNFTVKTGFNTILLNMSYLSKAEYLMIIGVGEDKEVRKIVIK